MSDQPAKPWRPSLTALIIWGLILGIACGLFFGEYCAWLKPIGDAFVGLLQMTVLPYITFALISNIGRLTFQQGRRLARVGTAVMLVLWLMGLDHRKLTFRYGGRDQTIADIHGKVVDGVFA